MEVGKEKVVKEGVCGFVYDVLKPSLIAIQMEALAFFLFVQDNRIIDAPRQRKQTKRYGNEDGDFELSDLDLEEDEEAPLPRRSSWTRVECFRVEKNLLIYGYVLFACCYGLP